MRGDWSKQLEIYTKESGKSPVLREQNRRLAGERFNLLPPSIADARQNIYELFNREVMRNLVDKRTNETHENVTANAMADGGIVVSRCCFQTLLVFISSLYSRWLYLFLYQVTILNWQHDYSIWHCSIDEAFFLAYLNLRVYCLFNVLTEISVTTVFFPFPLSDFVFFECYLDCTALVWRG